MDLAELVAEDRFLTIADLLAGLPGTSRTKIAMQDDPDYAMAIAEASLEQEQSSEKWTPDLADWTYTNDLLTQVLDQLGVMTYYIGAQAGAKPSKPRNNPRPRTGVDKAKEILLRREGEAMYADFGLPIPDWDLKVVREEQ